MVEPVRAVEEWRPSVGYLEVYDEGGDFESAVERAELEALADRIALNLVVSTFNGHFVFTPTWVNSFAGRRAALRFGRLYSPADPQGGLIVFDQAMKHLLGPGQDRSSLSRRYAPDFLYPPILTSPGSIKAVRAIATWGTLLLLSTCVGKSFEDSEPGKAAIEGGRLLLNELWRNAPKVVLWTLEQYGRDGRSEGDRHSLKAVIPARTRVPPRPGRASSHPSS